MIKLLIFDLDGVLVSTKKLHFDALNNALQTCGYDPISYDEHLKIYDGLPTRTKLNLLSKNKNIPYDMHNKIWATKQANTEVLLNEHIKLDERWVGLFKSLSDKYSIHIATNSIKPTTNRILSNLGILSYINYVITNEDVINPKPNPAIYLKCFITAGVAPKECLIFEDSPHGLEAAIDSGGHLFTVTDMAQVDYENIVRYIDYIEKKSYYTNRFMNKKHCPIWFPCPCLLSLKRRNSF